MLKRALILWALLAVAIGLTAALVPGMHIDGGFFVLLGIALVFSLINIVIGTLLRLLTLPLTVITLGLSSILVNAVLLAITAWWIDRLSVDNFLAALLGAVLISVFSSILQWIFLRPKTAT